MTNVKVYVSYSWSIEDNTGVVGEIEAFCPSRNIELVRDKHTMQHGDVILAFMDQLTSGDHIITVFSEPYFKSQWCMFELLQIWQKGGIQERTHPIIADGCDLQSLAYRIEIVKYWTAEHEKIKGLLAGVDPSLIGEEYKEANRIRDIAQNVSDLMGFAKGRVTTPLSDLRKEDYSPILDLIRPIAQQERESSHTTGSVFKEVAMDSSKARQIKRLQEQLEIWKDKLHEFKKELARAEGADARYSIRSKIKADISPEIVSINKKYQALLNDDDVGFTEPEAASIMSELASAIDNRPSDLSQEVTQKLETIQKTIQDQNKSATAKLKVALPVIPGLASYELDLDTENFLGEVWEKVRSLLNNKADQVNP